MHIDSRVQHKQGSDRQASCLVMPTIGTLDELFLVQHVPYDLSKVVGIHFVVRLFWIILVNEAVGTFRASSRTSHYPVRIAQIAARPSVSSSARIRAFLS